MTFWPGRLEIGWDIVQVVLIATLMVSPPVFLNMGGGQIILFIFFMSVTAVQREFIWLDDILSP
jgi:hypothetical protein